jgi:hypothetical protein
VGGRFRLTLRDREAPGVERTTDVAAADLVSGAQYQFQFEPIEDSAGRQYQFEIAPTPSNPGRGVALWATRGDRTPERALRINGVPRWGALAFQTHTPSLSLIRSLLSARDGDRPPQWLVLAGLLGAWIALRYVLRDVMAAPDAVPGAAVPAAAARAAPGIDVVAAVTTSSSSSDPLPAPPAALR